MASASEFLKRAQRPLVVAGVQSNSFGLGLRGLLRVFSLRRFLGFFGLGCRLGLLGLGLGLLFAFAAFRIVGRRQRVALLQRRWRRIDNRECLGRRLFAIVRAIVPRLLSYINHRDKMSPATEQRHVAPPGVILDRRPFVVMLDSRRGSAPQLLLNISTL